MPRLQVTQSSRDDAFLLFDNYTKRNSIAAYVQSHGAIGTKIINTVNQTNMRVTNQGLKSTLLQEEEKKENLKTQINYNRGLNKPVATFWLYVTIREELLPINYYNNMIEAMVMSDIFNWLFQKLD